MIPVDKLLEHVSEPDVDLGFGVQRAHYERGFGSQSTKSLLDRIERLMVLGRNQHATA
jgi:hypothetical protein